MAPNPDGTSGNIHKKNYGEDTYSPERENMLSQGTTDVTVRKQTGPQSEKGQLSQANAKSISSKKLRIMKNVMVINVAFFMMWSGFVGLSIIQSSIVGEVGTVGLGINFGCSIIACLFFGPLLIRLVGTKYTMVGCFAGFCAWMSYNFYPCWETAIPASIINGLSNGPIWTAQSTYFTLCGLEYAQLTGEREDVVLARFFGIFFCFVLIGITSGCAVTSIVLKITAPPAEVFNVTSNITDPLMEAMMANCGAEACPLNPADFMVVMNGTNATIVAPFDPVAEMGWRLQALTAVHVGFGLCGLLLVLIFVDRQKQEGNVSFREEARVILGATFRQMKRRRQLLLTPLNIYAGMTQSFILADITMFFIVCSIGVDLLGFALMTYGVVSCLASILGGTIIKYTGRIPLFCAGLLVHLCMHLFLLLWKPDPSMWYVFFIIPGLWAYGDGTLISQINALYGFLFSDNPEGAFSTYRTYESFGIMMGYMYNSVLCVKHKIYLMLIMFVLGVIGYIICEISQKRYDKTHGAPGEKEMAEKKWSKEEEAKKMSAIMVDGKVSSM